MKVSQMRKLLKGLPGNMMILMDTGDNVLVSVCAENSQIVELPLLDEDEIEDDETEFAELLLLVPCHHKCETEIGELNSQPELN